MEIITRLSPSILPTISITKNIIHKAVEFKVAEVFNKYFELISQGFSFVWGGSDLYVAGVFSQKSWKQILQDAFDRNELITAILLIVSGILGLPTALNKINKGPEEPWIRVAYCASNVLFFFANIFYLMNNMKRWDDARGPQAPHEKIMAILGILNSLGYLVVSFFAIFGVIHTALAVISFLSMLTGAVKIILELM